jgi:hypothetical protein
MAQLIEPPPCLVNEDSIELGLAQTTHDLRAMRDHEVLPAHKEVISVLDPRTGCALDRWTGMVQFVFALVEYQEALGENEIMRPDSVAVGDRKDRWNQLDLGPGGGGLHLCGTGDVANCECASFLNRHFGGW